LPEFFDVSITLGVSGVFLLSYFWFLKRVPAVPISDPLFVNRDKGDNMEILNTVFPWIAWTVCAILFLLQSLFGAVFTFSLLGHFTQLVFKKSSLRIERR